MGTFAFKQKSYISLLIKENIFILFLLTKASRLVVIVFKTMATLAVEMQRNIARGDKKVNGFKGQIRSLENLGLEVGDEFTLPESYEVYEQKIGDNSVQYIMVELTNGNAKPFYPSTFTKSRTVYNEDGTSTGTRVHTKGSAAELFRQYGDIQQGMDALKGKTLKVTDIELVDTLRYGTSSLMKAQIPTIELV